MDAQRESRDADIFRRVVDRIKLCVEEATALGSAAAPAGGSAASTEAAAAEAPSAAAAGAGAPAEGGDPREKDGTRCNWALAHAACRVCRVVGRTFQVAIR